MRINRRLEYYKQFTIFLIFMSKNASTIVSKAIKLKINYGYCRFLILNI